MLRCLRLVGSLRNSQIIRGIVVNSRRNICYFLRAHMSDEIESEILFISINLSLIII